MNNFFERYLKFMSAINWLMEWAMRLILGFMIVVVFTQVLSRFLHFSMPQLEELARYSNIYLAFIAVAYGLGKNSLIKVDTLQAAAKGWLRAGMLFLANIVSLATALLYIYSGIALVRLGVGQNSSSMGFDLAYVYIIIPIGFTVAILNLAAFWLDKRKGRG